MLFRSNGDPKPSFLNHHDTRRSSFVSFVFFVVTPAQESNHERHEPHEQKERQTFLILWSFDGCEGSSLATWLRPRTKAIHSKPPRHPWFEFRVFRVFRGSHRAGIHSVCSVVPQVFPEPQFQLHHQTLPNTSPAKASVFVSQKFIPSTVSPVLFSSKTTRRRLPIL